MKKRGTVGGMHPAECTCGRIGCWSNQEWLRARVAKAIKEGKPLPANWPEKFRNMVIQNAAGEEVMGSKSGEVPEVGEAVRERLRKLPMPSEVRQQTIITEQVPLAVNLPWAMIAVSINSQLPPDAPAGAKIDSSKEQEAILNKDVQDAFPGLLVGPRVKLAIDIVLWSLPAWLFWLPRWLKGKFKNFRWPWEKKKPIEPDKPAEPEAPK